MSESNINVAVKIRPLIKREIEKKIPACWKSTKNTLIDVTGANEFNFDLIYDEESSTAELYDKVARPIISNALAGVNGTVFAYGQTSSGKTHTMMGNETSDGLMLMAIKHIFNEVESSNIEFVLRVGFIEIYNEKVYDLYDPDNVDLKMVEKNNDAYVNCKEAICKCVDDMYNVIKIGNKNKKIGDTDMNDRSSRSHTIFRISIESIDAVSEKAKISNLNLVDLAGSERASQTNSTGARFVEGAHINKSLLSLSKVVNKLINNESCHINYRDSKLTRYLQSSLGGNALAAIICTICPTTLEETISTLYFAQRAMKVTNKPRVNEIISDATMIKQLHNQIKALKVELEKAKSEANSTVPRILQELSLYQGNILNYKKAENKAKLRRRTWTTFDNDLPSISEAAPLILGAHKNSLNSINGDAVTPIFQMVTANRGTFEDPYDAQMERDEMADEFEYKSKYLKLLQEYEELQEFTDWEKKLNIEPDAEAVYREQIDGLEREIKELQEKSTIDPDAYQLQIEALEQENKMLQGELETLQRTPTINSDAEIAYKSQISALEKDIKQLQVQLSTAQQEKSSIEYSFELHQKKAEQRERDLVNMMDELKNGSLVNHAVEEKNHAIAELQERIAELSAANDGLLAKATQHGDLEERLVKMAKVEVELEELRNTITALTHTVLTLENEKKEMSIRFNESITGGLALVESSSQSILVATPAATPTSTLVVQSSSVQTEVLVAESDKLEAAYDELSNKVMELIEENEELKQRSQELEERLNDNCDTQDEEVALIRSEKVAVEIQLKRVEDELKAKEGQLQEVAERVETLEAQLEEMEKKYISVEEQLKAAISKTDEGSVVQEELWKLRDEAAKVVTLQVELKEREANFEELSKANQELQNDVRMLAEDRDGLMKELEVSVAKVKAMTEERDAVAEKLEKSVQEIHAATVERDCLANDLKNKVELISDLERNVEAGHSDLKKDLTDAQVEKTRLTTEVENKSVELAQLRQDHEGVVLKLAAVTSELEETRKESEIAAQQVNEENKRKLCDQEKLFDESKVALEVQIENLLTAIENSRGKLSEREKELEESQRAWQVDMESIRVELQEKTAQLEKSDALLRNASESSGSLGDLQRERDRLTSELDAQLQKVHLLTKESSSLKLTIGEMESLMQEREITASKDLEDLQRELMDKTQQIEHLESQIESFGSVERELDELKRSKEALQSEVDAQQVKILALHRDKQELRSQLEAAQDNLSEREDELKRAQEEAAEVAQKTRQRNSLSHELQEKIHGLETRLTLYQEEMANKDAQIEQYLSQMQDTETLIDEKFQELTAARTGLQVMTERVKQLEAELEQSANDKETLVSQLEAAKEKLRGDVAAFNVDREVAEQRFNALGKKLRGVEDEKRELSEKLKATEAEKEQLKASLETACRRRAEVEERTNELRHKNEIVRNRVAELEQALTRKEQQLLEMNATVAGSQQQSRQMRAHEEEVSKLQAQIKKMRSEQGTGSGSGSGHHSGGYGNRERKARRSSTFDNNRDLFSDRSVGTMTDPVSESCQCSSLIEKIQELKKSNMLKDLQMVQLRENEKRSPMLLENYNLKQTLQQFKDKVASQTKDLRGLEQKLYQALKQCKSCETKKSHHVQCQTLPDMNGEVIADLKKELAQRMKQYQEAKEVARRQHVKIVELEQKQDENDRNVGNVVQNEDTELRHKYEVVKKIVEQRYNRIRIMEQEKVELTQRRTCVKCSAPLSCLQVPQ